MSAFLTCLSVNVGSNAITITSSNAVRFLYSANHSGVAGISGGFFADSLLTLRYLVQELVYQVLVF